MTTIDRGEKKSKWVQQLLHRSLGQPVDARYNTTKYSDSYWKALVTYIHYSHPNTLTMCEVMRSAAESLMYDGKLRDDVDFNIITLGLKQDI